MTNHSSGKAVRLSRPIQIPLFSIQVLNAYQTDPVLTLDDRTYIYSRQFIPMIVYESPVAVALAYDSRNRAQWRSRFRTAIDLLVFLRMVICCFMRNDKMPSYLSNPKRAMACFDNYEGQVEELDSWRRTQYEQILKAFEQGQLNERQALEQTIELLQRYTIRLIRLEELTIITFFNLQNVPLTKEDDYPDVDMVTPEFFKTLLGEAKVMYDAKNKIENLRLDKASSDLKPHQYRQFFDTDNFLTRFHECPKEEVYRGYMDRYTAWEYFKFLDIDKNE